MILTLIIIAAVLASSAANVAVRNFAYRHYGPEDEESDEFVRTVLVVTLITALIPFVLGCAVGLYAIS